MNKPKALRLADELDAIPETVADPDLIQETAAELRRLCAKNETLKQSVARLQQHHATAWNRGHTMGMKANEDTARRALDAVKQDAWGNTQLTEALLKAEAQRDALLEACKAYDQWADKTLCYDRVLRPIRAQIRAAINAVEGEKK